MNTYTDFSSSHSIDSIHVFVELWAMAITVPVVCRDKEVSVDHLMLQERRPNNAVKKQSPVLLSFLLLSCILL